MPLAEAIADGTIVLGRGVKSRRNVLGEAFSAVNEVVGSCPLQNKHLDKRRNTRDPCVFMIMGGF
jgi:hypothetical protein